MITISESSGRDEVPAFDWLFFFLLFSKVEGTQKSVAYLAGIL